MNNLSPDIMDGIQTAVELVSASRLGAAMTGAGHSTPSGIPDFRSTEGGLWTKYNPMEVASLLTFRQHPERFFEWVRPLLGGMLAAEPNPAHHALSQLEEAGYLHGVITQNIDGLHQRAGSQIVHEVHGTLESLTCVSCYVQQDAELYLKPFVEKNIIPTCPHCDSLLKPDVILFGEQLPHDVWAKAEKLAKSCDLMIVAGCSLEVVPVAGLPMTAVQNGAKLVIVNYSPTYADEIAEVVLTGDVAEILPLIAQGAIHDR